MLVAVCLYFLAWDNGCPAQIWSAAFFTHVSSLVKFSVCVLGWLVTPPVEPARRWPQSPDAPLPWHQMFCPPCLGGFPRRPPRRVPGECQMPACRVWAPLLWPGQVGRQRRVTRARPAPLSLKVAARNGSVTLKHPAWPEPSPHVHCKEMKIIPLESNMLTVDSLPYITFNKMTPLPPPHFPCLPSHALMAEGRWNSKQGFQEDQESGPSVRGLSRLRQGKQEHPGECTRRTQWRRSPLSLCQDMRGGPKDFPL